MKKLLLLSLLTSSAELFAIDAYKCKVDHAKTLGPSGQLEGSNYTNRFVGLEFVVDKYNGRITGGVSNHDAFTQPKVLDYGSGSQAFKVITIYQGFVSVKYLYIEEFSPKKQKPFIYIESNNVINGLCVPY